MEQRGPATRDMLQPSMGFEERHPETAQPPALAEKKIRIRELGLKLEGSPVERLIEQLYRELESAGISLKPPCFVSDEWGCPDGVPAIGVPFYLVDPELAAVEERETEELESELEIARILRHEAGHAFCYAHKLYTLPAFRDLFGPITRPYLDDFTPRQFSRAFVRHLPGWYAQKHPDEDFAETFAVFLTPASDWRKQYAGWPALKKLTFLDERVKELGRAEPSIVASAEDMGIDEGLDVTVPEHYQARKPEEIAGIGDLLDSDLVELFGAPNGAGEPASKFLRQHRKHLVNGTAYWTGARTAVVRGLVDHLASRADTLGLVFLPEKAPVLAASAAALITTLVLNHLMRGKFVEL